MARTTEPDPLDASIIHMIHRASQCAANAFQSEVGEFDLTPRQLAVLRTVAANDEASQTRIVELTGIDRSTLADIMRRMIKKGLLQRKRTKEDARAYAVRLTEAGRALLRKATPASERVDSRLLDALPVARRETFMRDLERLVAELGKAATV